MRADRLLSNLGFCSRSEAREFLRFHEVLSAETLITSASENLDPENTTVDGEKIIPPGKLTIVLHKPVGFTCSHKDNGKIIYDLFPEEYIRRKPLLSSIGRLDKESSGLLLLTDDGDLNHKLTAPKKHIPKRYLVTTKRALTKTEHELFGTGDFMLSGEHKPLLPVEIAYVDDFSCYITLHEGRNRQIRRMFEALSNEVVTLHRLSIGELTLDGLEEGDWKIASDADIMAAQKGYL